ncbi:MULTISPECIES: hypothetical protein [unclassified Streptomyces]|uniref:hypothetical protein n=1 Tax=unclassified Streptomyces TaxID=2593676 RepID=UPI0024755B25|nr:MULTISPECIES: hypothetical protein [unclassified Streptomyces]
MTVQPMHATRGGMSNPTDDARQQRYDGLVTAAAANGTVDGTESDMLSGECPSVGTVIRAVPADDSDVAKILAPAIDRDSDTGARFVRWALPAKEPRVPSPTRKNSHNGLTQDGVRPAAFPYWKQIDAQSRPESSTA